MRDISKNLDKWRTMIWSEIGRQCYPHANFIQILCNLQSKFQHDFIFGTQKTDFEICMKNVKGQDMVEE